MCSSDLFRALIVSLALCSASAFMPSNRAMPTRQAVQVGASGSTTQIENRDTTHPPLSSLENMEDPWQPDAVATVFMDSAKAEAVTPAPPPPPAKKAKKEAGDDAPAAKKAKKAKKAAAE